MDAAQKLFKNTAILFAMALLVAAPGRSQTLSASPNPVALTGAAPNVVVTVSGSGPYTITPTGAFFSVNGGGNAPDSFSVLLGNTTCLNSGGCNGSIKLHPTTGGGSDLTIPVTFTTGGTGGGGGVITVNPTSVTFNTTANQIVSSQVTLSTSSASAISFTVTPSTSWLSQSFVSSNSVSSSSSAILTVVANTAGFSTSQSGQITLTPSNGGATTVISVTVNLNGSTNSTYSVNPTSVSLAYPTSPQSQSIFVSNNSGITTFNALVTNCNITNFLLINGSTQLFGQAVSNGLLLTLSNPQNLATNVYTCQVLIQNPSNASDQVTLLVTLTVNGGSGSGSYAVNPSTAAFTSTQGNSQIQSTTIGISSSVASTYNATFTPSSGGNWLILNSIGTQVNNQAVVNGLTLVLSNPQVLGVGFYQGTVTISNPNGTGGSATVSVSLNITNGTSGVTASPSSLTFSASPSSAPPAQNLSINVPNGTTFAINTTAASGVPSFLSFTGSGLYTNSQNLQVTASALSTSGTYTNTINVIVNGAVVLTIPVTYTVGTGSGGGNYTVSPSSLSFSGAPGVGANSQNVFVTVPTGINFSTSVTSSSGSVFITNPCQGCSFNGPQNLTVSVNPNLTTGTYVNNINLTANGSQFATVTVTYTVGSGGTGTGGLVAPTSLAFFYQASTGVPPQQTITVAASGQVTASSNQTWLVANPVGSFVTVSVIPQGLAAGSVNQGVVSIVTSSGTQNVNVTLTVSSGMALHANPGTVNFSASPGSPNYQTTVQISASDGSNQQVTATSQSSWITLSGSAGATPVSFLVTANASTLCNGLNVGSITVTGTGASNSPLSIPVVALVSGSSVTSCGSGSTGPLTLSATSLSFSGGVNGTTPANQNLSVTSSSNLTFTVNTTIQSGNTNWLAVISPCNNCTLSGNQNLTVSVNQSNLAAGTYQGSIVLTSNGVTQTVPVTLTVGASGGSGNITASPATLTFTASVGGSAPAAQNVAVTSASGASGIGYIYTVSSSGWLSASVAGTTLNNGQSLTTPTTLVVAANPAGLAASATPYTGSITLTPNGGTAITISVNLTVTNGVTLSQSSVTFTYRGGDTPPSPQTLQVTGGANLAFTSSVTSSGNCTAGWLAVAPTTGGTTGSSGSATLTVAVNPAGLPAGTCNGVITVAGAGTATGSVTLAVTFTITAPLPTITKVTSSASFLGQSISPGEVITIFGTGLGPTPFVTLGLDSSGKVTTTLGGVQVLVGGIAAPMIFASNTQVSAVVPYDIAILQRTTVIVKFLGQTSNGIDVQITSTTPAIFTANASGTGPGAILNGNLSPNSPSNPAPKGDTIAIYMTGEGQTSPAGVNGSVTTVSLPAPRFTPQPLLPVAVLIDGQPAAISFAGEAPGIVAGVLQVNVQIPANARTGDLPLIVSIGGNSSQNGVTVSVR